MPLSIGKPEPTEELSGAAALFLEHAKGLMIKYLPCVECRGETMHFVEIRDGRQYMLCDLCGLEHSESA